MRTKPFLPLSSSRGQVGSNVPPIVDDVLHSPGQALDPATRAFFEPRFGHDFSQVRVHEDAKADESAMVLNALAFTVGRDLVFGRGMHEPSTLKTKQLMAHELTHVVQQSLSTNSQKPEDIVPAVGGLTPSERSIQRICAADVGKVKGCTAVSEDIFGPTFLFKLNSDDFQPGEEENLKDLTKRLTSLDKLVIHGFASEEGPPEFNENLSCLRAKKASSVLMGAGVPADQIDTLFKHGATAGLRRERRSVVIEIVQRRRGITFEEQGLLDRLKTLGEAAKGEGGDGASFHKAVEDFKTNLKKKIESLKAGDPLPNDIDLVMKALMLWSKDPGNKWGEGIWDSNDLQMSAPEYATVPARQHKCTAYVAETIYQSLGLVFKVHKSEQEKGKYFPYRANQWGDSSLSIPNFPVVTDPKMGDIWSDGHHTGIYLGEYAAKTLYISARDYGSGVFGLKEEIQKAHGIQVKFLPGGGVFRRYTP